MGRKSRVLLSKDVKRRTFKTSIIAEPQERDQSKSRISASSFGMAANVVAPDIRKCTVKSRSASYVFCAKFHLGSLLSAHKNREVNDRLFGNFMNHWQSGKVAMATWMAIDCYLLFNNNSQKARFRSEVWSRIDVWAKTFISLLILFARCAVTPIRRQFSAPKIRGWTHHRYMMHVSSSAPNSHIRFECRIVTRANGSWKQGSKDTVNFWNNEIVWMNFKVCN